MLFIVGKEVGYSACLQALNSINVEYQYIEGLLYLLAASFTIRKCTVLNAKSIKFRLSIKFCDYSLKFRCHQCRIQLIILDVTLCFTVNK
jgi:hypothetical protein